MGLGSRFFIRNAMAMGVALGVALLLLFGVNSISPWIWGENGSALAVQRTWMEIRYLVDNEGSDELLRQPTQEAITAISRKANCEWMMLLSNEDALRIAYRTINIEASEINALQNALATNGTMRHGFRTFQVYQLALHFSDDSSGILVFLAPAADLLGLEREFLLMGMFIFSLAFVLASIWLGSWLQESITRPLLQLKAAAMELTRGEDLPEIAGEGEGEVAELAVALEQLRLRLKESVRLRDKADAERSFLISSISHDLKTPLTAISGYLEAVQMPELPEERKQYYLHNAEIKAQQLRYLIDDLLLYSRLESQQAIMVLRPVDMRSFIAQMVAEYVPLAERKQAAIRFNDQLTEDLMVSLDLERFPRVLQNIFDNALRYIPDADGCIDVDLRASRRDVIIEIRDNGPGLAQGEHERVFERFYRSDSARSGQGSGLGLAIAWQIVHAHGGRIWSREPSSTERGCIMVISLPRGEGL